jgi:Ca-activated chloride channel homolog
MSFQSPWAFLLLLVLPAAALFHGVRRRRTGLSFSSTKAASALPPSLRQRLSFLPLLLRLLAVALLVVCLARPQVGRVQVRDVTKGIAIEMVLDRSGSMDQAHFEYHGKEYSRLEMVKEVFREFVLGNQRDLKGRPSDLLGMVVFGSYADTLCPLTLAHDALSGFVQTVQGAKTQEEGQTAIGDAIMLAAARLSTMEEEIRAGGSGTPAGYQLQSKVIILLTDGANNFGKADPREAAKTARDWGIRIYTIGVGSADDYAYADTLFGRSRVQAGAVVDQETLREIAAVTGGVFRMAADPQALREVYREIDGLEKSEIESLRTVDYREAFAPFALAALLLLAVEAVLSATVFRRIP